MVRKKDTFTSGELCARYGCVLRTIRAKQKKLGFPDGDIYSKELVFSMAKVIAWEKVHMPHLHGGDAALDDAEEWARMKSGEAQDDVPPTPKRRAARRKK